MKNERTTSDRKNFRLFFCPILRTLFKSLETFVAFHEVQTLISVSAVFFLLRSSFYK